MSKTRGSDIALLGFESMGGMDQGNGVVRRSRNRAVACSSVEGIE